MNHRSKVRYSKLALGLAIALATAPAMAQNTTANIGGRVTTAEQTVVAGAQVTITHLPSGTVSQAVTDANGRYSARGLRVGGPYRVTITKDGKTETIDNVFLQLAETTQVNALLGATPTTIETVEVTAADIGYSPFSATAVGAGSVITRDQLDSFASIQRNLQDYARLDPRISQTDKERGEISAAGQNSRYNRITIDGVNTSDTFGLEANNLPTGRQPISIDAIEEVQVNVSNYDVTQTGYTGANINAVTKSGTNEFKGSVAYVYRNNDAVGDFDGRSFLGFEDENTWALTLGGPIVKDKLFFFLAYEDFKQTSNPGAEFGPIGSSATNPVAITQAEIDQAIGIAQTRYGASIGERLDEVSDNTEDLLFKLDWNISDNQRASLRYNKTEQNQVITPNNDRDDLSLSSHWYDQVKTFETVNAELFSDWSDRFSTELKLTSRTYDSAPNTFSRLPQVVIDIGPNQLNFGTEQFRHANVLSTDTTNVFAAGNLFLGDHEIKFGADWEQNDIFNLFLESSLGRYRFGSLANFQNGIVREYVYRTPQAGFSVNDTAANWTYENLGLFVQDTWAVNYNLTLTFGVRYDMPAIDDKPLFNQSVLDTFGLRNDGTIDGNGLFQPRFGFNYTFDSDRPTQLRGGIGLFQGAAPSVWLSNPFTNNGRTIFVYGCGTGGLASCTGAPITPTLDPDNQPLLVVGGQPRTDVDIVDPSLKQPSVWKANLAFDHELPFWGLVGTAELLLTEVNEGIYYEHLALGAPTGTGPDGRQMFWNANGYDPARWNQFGSGSGVSSRANRPAGFNDVVLARPTSKGGGENLTLSLQKPFGNSDWFWQVAYAYTNATEVSPLTSSRAISNWNGASVFNHEEKEYRANYAVRDRITAAVAWKHNFFAGYETKVSAFYEGRAGRPFSYVFDNDANGDGVSGNDLFYMPSSPGDVLFGSAAEEAAFWSFVESDAYLNSIRGQVAERNAARGPWVNTVDVRISQEIPGFAEGHKGEIALDILNFGNLLNSDWGLIEEYSFPFNRGVVEYGGIDASTGKYVYRFNTPDSTFFRDRRGESRWTAQLTVRYRF
ncbi:MAG: Oar protein [Silanimonas sp.]|nr:MAG: Oar protein [Silanimonas sp.]